MSTTLLRTLTRKSTLKFGEYAHCCVQELLNKHKHMYLRWVYYNCDMITFKEDILEEINLKGDFLIVKPGKCPEKNNEMIELIRSKTSAFTKLKIDMRRKKIFRIKNNNSNIESKQSLTSRNHGH